MGGHWVLVGTVSNLKPVCPTKQCLPNALNILKQKKNPNNKKRKNKNKNKKTNKKRNKEKTKSFIAETKQLQKLLWDAPA